MCPAHNAEANLNAAQANWDDDTVTDFGGEGISTDVIAESTAAAGVTIDGVTLKDGKFTCSGDTSAGDNATIGYTATEGLIITGQGSATDIVFKNDADAAILTVQTGTTQILRVGGDKTLPITITDAAAYTVLESSSGKIHFVDNQAQDCTITLPSASAGLYFQFVSTMEAADGHDWIIDTGSDTNYYKGGLIFNDSDAADGIDLLSAGNGSSNSKLQVNLPSVSTHIHMCCVDGTTWQIWGRVFSTAAPAFSDQ